MIKIKLIKDEVEKSGKGNSIPHIRGFKQRTYNFKSNLVEKRNDHGGI